MSRLRAWVTGGGGFSNVAGVFSRGRNPTRIQCYRESTYVRRALIKPRTGLISCCVATATRFR